MSEVIIGAEIKYTNYLAMQLSEDGKQMQIQIQGVTGLPLTKANLLIALHTLHIAVEDYVKEQEARLKSKVIATVPDSLIERLRA